MDTTLAYAVKDGAALLDKMAGDWRTVVRQELLEQDPKMLHWIYTPNVQHKPSYEFFMDMTGLTEEDMAAHGFYRDPPAEVIQLWANELVGQQ